MSRKRYASPVTHPVIRFRSMLLGMVAIAALITGPLLLVWKQVYITDASQRIEKLTDSLTVLSREITTLRLRCERLSSKERIESFAKMVLDLEHPSADRIVIVRIPAEEDGGRPRWSRELAAFLKKSLRGARG